jgi:hypothetical protein
LPFKSLKNGPIVWPCKDVGVSGVVGFGGTGGGGIGCVGGFGGIAEVSGFGVAELPPRNWLSSGSIWKLYDIKLET